MANTPTTTSTVAPALLAKWVEQYIREKLFPTLLLPALITHGDLRGKRSKTWSSPQWGGATAKGVDEDVAVESDAMTLTNKDITVSEIAVSLEPTDLSVETSDIQPADYGARGVIAVKQKLERDIAALFAGVTQSVGTSGQEVSLDTLIKAMELLETADDEGPYFGVIHPRQVGAYRRAIAGTSGSTAAVYGTGIVDPALKAIPGFVGDFLGVPLFKSTYVPKVNTNTDFAGCFFSMKAFGMATLREPRVEAERSAKKRTTAMVVTAVYGVGELEANSAVRVISKVAA